MLNDLCPEITSRVAPDLPDKVILYKSAISNYIGKQYMGEQTFEFELLTCINMLNNKINK